MICKQKVHNKDRQIEFVDSGVDEVQMLGRSCAEFFGCGLL